MRSYFFILLLFTVANAMSQVDVRRYASEDLFSIKPIVSTDKLVEDQPASTSWVEKKMESAVKFMEAGQNNKAYADLQDLIEYDDKIPVFYYLQGLILMSEDSLEASKNRFNASLSASAFFLEAKYMLGMVALRQGDEKLARDYFKGLTEIKQYEALGYYGLGYEALQQGNAYGASRDFRRCIEADSTFVDAYSTLATLELITGNLRGGTKVLEAGIKRMPEWEEGIMMRAILMLLVESDFVAFEQNLDRLIEISPDNYHYLFMKSAVLIEREEWHQAIVQYHQASQMDTTNSADFNFTSRISHEKDLRDLIDYYFAQTDLTPAIRKEIEQGICKMIGRDADEAYQIIRAANERFPTAIGCLIEGAAGERDYRDNKVIIKAYSQAIELDSLNSYAYFRRGELFVKEKNYEAAYLDFDKLVKLHPKEKEVWKKRGIMLTEMNYLKHAYRDFSVAMAMDKTDLELYFNRASIACELQDYVNAQVDLMYLLEKNPKDGDAWHLLYVTRLALGDTLDAFAKLDSASTHMRFNSDVHNELLEMATGLGNTEVMEKAHIRRVKSDWNRQEYLLDRGKFYYQQKRYAEAQADLEKYLDKRSTSGNGYYYLSKVFTAIGEEKKADRNLRKAEKYGYQSM
jgi:tetratricopeptide (TPR) repeat protein